MHSFKEGGGRGAGGGGRGFTVMRMRAVTASRIIIRANTKFEESKEIIRCSTQAK